MFVVGTAGHIDHGKSALVKALSGIDPDRLPEEKLRGLTIDLGFAWFDLPGGDSVGVVDVPGHERFIKNMVAGVGGIDAVMLIIAADDGWMPQTSEHLDILSLLDIKAGIVVLTKTDLVDEEIIELQKDDIAGRLKGTFLENAPIVSFSAKNNSGKDDVLKAVQNVLGKNIVHPMYNSPRLYIDRSFVVKGMGTVVTGTLIEGEIKLGQDLEINPLGMKVRVRGLQTHKKAIETATPGSRVAVNLTGASKDDAHRGSALVSPGHFEATDTLGVKVRMLPNMKLPLKNASEVIFLLGTSITHAKLKLFKRRSLNAGDEDYAVFHLEDKICCRVGDRFIVRRLSPPITVGGGIVLDWDFDSIKQKKAVQYEILKVRDDLALGSIIKSELIKDINLKPAKLKLNSRYNLEQIEKQIAGAEDIVKAGNTLVRKEHIDKYLEPALELLSKDHETRTWAKGVVIGQMAKQLKIPANELDEVVAYLQSGGEVVLDSGLLRLKTHEPHLNKTQKALSQKLHAILSAAPLASPLKKKFISDDPGYEIVINFLVDCGEILELQNGVLFAKNNFETIVNNVISFIKKRGKVTASEIKDHLKTTRKYIIPLLEELDSRGVTIRDGDYRTMGD